MGHTLRTDPPDAAARNSCNKANEYPTASEREDASDAADQQIIEEFNLYLTHLFGRNELDPPKFEPLPNQQPLPFTDGDDDMPATKKPAKQTPATMTDDELLAWSLGYDSPESAGKSKELRRLQECGATDAELLTEIQVEWSTHNGGSARPYFTCDGDKVWGTAIWFDHDHQHGAPRLFYQLKPTGIKGAVEVEGSLLREVRRVLGIENRETNGPSRETDASDSDEFETLKSKGKSRTKHPAATSTTTPAGIAALDPEAGATSSKLTSPAELIISPEIVRRPLEWFRKSPFDTRTNRPKEWLEELAASLKRDGQLQPCLARPNGEHIAGWTRVEAARLAGLEELDVRIVSCDDTTARRLILLENAKRRDLTEREKTEAYNALADDYGTRGLTQRQLAEDLGLSESALSNNLRLRSIPQTIWARHEAGGLSTDQVRALAVHAARPKFVEGFIEYLDKRCFCKVDEQPEHNHFDSAFDFGISKAFRPMTADSFGTGCQFKPTPEQKEQLEIVKVKRRWGGEVNMAANVTLWNKLNKEAKAKAKAKEAAKSAQAADPKAQKAAAKVEAQQRAARRRLLIEESWHIARGLAIAARFAKPRKQDHAAALRLRLWISQTEPYRWSIELDVLTGDEAGFIAEVCADVHKYFTGMSFAYQQPAIEDLCKWLNVDPVPHWKPTRQLLNHCTPDELQELAEEFDLPPGTTANDLPDVMLDKWPGGYIPPLFVLEKPDAKPAKKGRK